MEVKKNFGFGDIDSPYVGSIDSPFGFSTPSASPCFSFDGETRFNQILSSNLIGDGSFSMAGWIRPSAYTATTQRAFYLYSDSSNYIFLSLPRNNSQIPSIVGLVNGVDISVELSGETVEVGMWQHWAITWNATDFKFRVYKNGVLEYTSSAAAGDFALGASTNFWAGRDAMSKNQDYRVYGALLSDANILSLYNKTHIATNLEAWYPYPDPDGSVYDWTGNNGQATVTGNQDQLYSLSGPLLPSEWRYEREYVVNGGFDTVSDWTTEANWSIGSGVATYDGLANTAIRQDIAMKAGRYQLTFLTTGTTPRFRLTNYSNTTTYVEFADYSPGSMSFDIDMIEDSGIRILGSSSGTSFTVDNISIKEIP